jgi:hypothetical protein
MDIGQILSRAWQIIWKNKILWIFGILASCSGGGGGTGNASSWSNSSSNSGGNFGDPNWGPLNRFFSDIQDWQIVLIVLGVILVILILVVIAVFLGTIGRIGLIRGTQQAEQGAEKLAFGELFSGSMPYFWRVFLLNLIVGLIFGLAAMAVAVMVILGTVVTLGIGAICLVPMICLLVPVGWVVQVVVEQSSVAIVLENLGITDGLRRGWEVVKANIGSYILLWLVLVLGLGIVAGVVIGLPFLFVVAPAAIGLIAGTENAVTGGLVFAGVCLACYLPVAIVLNGILRSFTGTAWTLAFMRLTNQPKAPELEVFPS